MPPVNSKTGFGEKNGIYAAGAPRLFRLGGFRAGDTAPEGLNLPLRRKARLLREKTAKGKGGGRTSRAGFS